jgi:prepilin-type N-terminal cleavage/methylation domain-containing protein
VTRKGYTLVELLVSLIIGAVVMAVMLTTYIALWKDQNKAAGLTESQEGAKAIVWKMAESFRAASLCTSTDTGCDLNSGVESAGTSSVIINSRDSNGNLVKTTYAINNGNFQVTVGSGSPATYASGASMTLTYYTSATYNATALVPFTPTSSTDSTLIAVQIVGSVTQNGVTETYQTLVRLNNGP